MLQMEGGASIPIKYKKLPRTDTLLMQGTELASVGFWPSALILYSKGQPMTAPRGALGCAFITGFHGKRCHGGDMGSCQGKKSRKIGGRRWILGVLQRKELVGCLGGGGLPLAGCLRSGVAAPAQWGGRAVVISTHPCKGPSGVCLTPRNPLPSAPTTPSRTPHPWVPPEPGTAPSTCH